MVFWTHPSHFVRMEKKTNNLNKKTHHKTKQANKTKQKKKPNKKNHYPLTPWTVLYLPRRFLNFHTHPYTHKSHTEKMQPSQHIFAITACHWDPFSPLPNVQNGKGQTLSSCRLLMSHERGMASSYKSQVFPPFLCHNTGKCRLMTFY